MFSLNQSNPANTIASPNYTEKQLSLKNFAKGKLLFKKEILSYVINSISYFLKILPKEIIVQERNTVISEILCLVDSNP